jgi:hypothetical protein
MLALSSNVALIANYRGFGLYDILDGATDGTTTFRFAQGPLPGRCFVRSIPAGRSSMSCC